MTHYLIFANGEPNDGPMVRRTLEGAAGARVVAADGGAHVASYFGFSPQVVLGDMDSIGENTLHALDTQGVEIHRHPPEKDETDLEIALKWAAAQGAEWIRIVGGIGGRFDQVLANVYLLALAELQGCDVQIIAGKQAIRLLSPGTYTLQGAAGDTLSLLPLGCDAVGIQTEALKYPLQDETLRFGPARGISNVMLADTAQITLREGLLLVVHTIGRAE